MHKPKTLLSNFDKNMNTYKKISKRFLKNWKKSPPSVSKLLRKPVKL